MPEMVTPSSPIAARVMRRIVKIAVGAPVVVAADLGFASGPDLEDTSIGDSPEAAKRARLERLNKSLWAEEQDAGRRRRYADYEELYVTPEVRQILRLICAFVFGGDTRTGTLAAKPFDVEFAEGTPDAVKEGINQAVMRMRLGTAIPQQVQSGLLKGDAFGEVVLSLVSVVGLRPRAASAVTVKWDVAGRLLGYMVRPDDETASTTRSAVYVTPLQMVHYAPHQRWGHMYGESLFYGLNSVGRQYNSVVDVIHVLAILASTSRRTATLEVPTGWTETQIGKWVKKLQAWNADSGFFDQSGTMQKRIATMLDFSDKIWPYRKGTSAPDFSYEPAAEFSQLLDVAKFDQGRFYLGTGFPKALAGLLDDASGLGGAAALTSADLALARLLRGYQQDAARLVLEYVIRAALVAEIPLDPEAICVRMPPLANFNEKLVAETLKLRADAAVELAGVVPMRWVLQHVLRVPEQEIEDMLLALAVDPVADAAVDAPDEAALARVQSQMTEQIETIRESVDLLKPVVVKLAGDDYKAILETLKPTP